MDDLSGQRGRCRPPVRGRAAAVTPVPIPTLSRAFGRGVQIAAVNYHNTPAYRAADLDAEFARLARRFAPAREDDLAGFLATGRWGTDRPGVVLAFFNGYRNNYDVALPLLERHGLIGWFFVATGYASCPAADQVAYGAARTLWTVPGEYADGRFAMDWDEIRDLDRRGHVVASHTRNHVHVPPDDAEAVEEEIVGAQDDFRRELGHPVRSFAWLNGGAYGDSRAGNAALDAAGYEFVVSTLRIQRLPGARPIGAGAPAGPDRVAGPA